ncbi:MAG TPA: hypothetical protein PLQ00_03480 [Thermoguttaceae bacterium]|nr:hypothetical protein [Thermoguttaceae bacterium]
MNAHFPSQEGSDKLAKAQTGPGGTPPADSMKADFPQNPPGKEEQHTLDEGQLDRLVDGELSEAQRREVLQQVAVHPEGWRRLALAFLEAQTWRQEMPCLVQTPIAPKPQPVVRPASTRPIRSPAWQILALAGGVLVAFLGGYWMRDIWPGLPTSSQEGLIVQSTPLPKQANQETQERKTPSEEDWLKEGPESSGRPSSSGWEYVTLTAGRGPDGVPEVVRVPVSPAVPERGLAPSRPPIPEELLELLRRWGAEVSHSRGFVPLRIEDGRQVVVPVEQVELYRRPQGERYQ